MSKSQPLVRESIEIASLTHQNPIPAASRVGPLLVSSITPPFNPGTRDCPESLADQIENLFTHVGQMLEAAGASFDDVAKMTFYVADPVASRKALNGPWLRHFPDPGSRPARHNLQVANTAGPALISCDFIAWLGDTADAAERRPRDTADAAERRPNNTADAAERRPKNTATT